MEIKVGDYVRTKDDLGIQRICKIKKTYSTNDFFFTDYGYWDIENIIKSNPNIIDLIEVGDYVNGDKVIRIFNPTFLSWGELPYVITQKNKYELDEIKSIVTKEQFKNMEYKVND